MPPSRVGIVGFLLLALPGAVFWAGAVMYAITSGDAGWHRTVSRAVTWFVFSAGFGIGAAVIFWWQSRTRTTA